MRKVPPMLSFILRRLLGMIPTLFLVSILDLYHHRASAGDFMTPLAANVGTSGSSMDAATVENLRHHVRPGSALPVRAMSPGSAAFSRAILATRLIGNAR